VSIRLRLVLSYAAMVVLPVLLSLLVAWGIAGVMLGKEYDWRILDWRPPSMEQRARQEAQTFDQLRRLIAREPDQLLDPETVGRFDRQLHNINTGLVLRHDGQEVYVSPRISIPGIGSQLPVHGAIRENHEPLLAGGSAFAYRQFDFRFSDGSPGSLFILTDISPLGQFMRDYLLFLAIAVLLILILTSGLLTYLVSRSIIRPVGQLQQAARRIQEGDLDFELACSGPAEIAGLCRNFEEMRQRLLQSVQVQLQYEENRKELISSITHDLKTPLTAIRGYVEGIRDGVADTPEKLARYLETIQTKASDMDQLLDELFLFSKLDLNREPFVFEVIDLRRYLAEATQDLQFDVERRGAVLKLELGGEEPLLVLADPDKLRRILNNLLHNAIQHLRSSEGQIVIRLRPQEQEVQVQVIDNGSGIAEQDLPHIFEPFYRANRARPVGGSGLGLSIARRIVEAHGGTIEAASSLGGGTTISFSLKRAGGESV